MTLTDQNRQRRPLRRGQRDFYYVVWHKADGQDILDGPFNTHDEAMREAMIGNCPFDIPNFPTRDRALATQMYKRNKLVSGQGLDNSLERIGHQVPKQEEGY